MYSTQVGTPNHIHGDRAAELQHGEMEAYCISNAIMLTATGEHNSPEQDTHAERMIGDLKYMSFALLQKANLKPSFWPHSLKYAAIVWNFTAKRRLGNRLPQELIKGCTQDLSFLMFPFGSPVRYPVYQQQLLDHWKKIFNSDDDSLIASTLSATTQRHVLLTADKRNILQKRHVCHFPQLSRNRLDGTVHTDTAFCNVLGSRRENSFQLFYHSPTAHVHVEPMRGKVVKVSAMQLNCIQHK